MEFVKVAAVMDVAPGKTLLVVAGGKDILLANVDGSLYAIANKCTHLGGSLAQGALTGSTVKCPKHGAEFDVKTGKMVGEAKLAFLKMKVKDEPTFPVKVEGSDIFVGIE